MSSELETPFVKQCSKGDFAIFSFKATEIAELSLFHELQTGHKMFRIVRFDMEVSS